MQVSVAAAARAPTWFSTRRLLEEKLSDLHHCSNLDDPFVAPKLVAAFSLSRHLPSVVNAFNQVPNLNSHLYNTLIRAQGQHYQHSMAFETFSRMQRNDVPPDSHGYDNCFPLLQMIHSHVEKFGFLRSDIFVPNSLIDLYFKCGSIGIDAGMRLFKEMEEQDVVTWNSVIVGLVKGGELEEACRVFDEMPERDVVTWNTILDGHVRLGRWIRHLRCLRECLRGMLSRGPPWFKGIAESGTWT